MKHHYQTYDETIQNSLSLYEKATVKIRERQVSLPGTAPEASSGYQSPSSKQFSSYENPDFSVEPKQVQETPNFQLN